MTDTSPTLVLGGTGHLGSRIVRHLLDRGAVVRVLTRNAETATARYANTHPGLPAPEFVQGDLLRSDDVKRALEGAQGMVVAVSAMTPGTIRTLWAIEHDAVIEAFEAAQQAGAQRVVFLSAYDFDRELIEKLDMDLGRLKMAVEAELSKTRLNWTVLGVPFSTELFFATLRGNRMMFPGGGPPGLPVSCPEDTGEIAAQAVLRGDLAGQRIRVPGPQALSFAQAAELLSRVTGRSITVGAVPMLPVAAAAWLSRPFYPYLYFLYTGMRLINAFPQALVEAVPADHARLHALFAFSATTLEEEARAKFGAQASSPVG